MNPDLHDKAARLIAVALVEGISPGDGAWLDQHLASCARCAELASSTERAVGSLRSVSIRIDPRLIERTQCRVRLRAQELRAERASLLPLWISCALSWGLGVASAPLVWRAFEWMGRGAGVPDLMWQVGFALWWVLPGVAGAVLISLRRPHAVD